MAKTIIKGLKPDGTIDAELKRTPVLITELIQKFPGMCEVDIYHALADIRESSERDQSMIRTLLTIQKQEHAKRKEEEKQDD